MITFEQQKMFFFLNKQKSVNIMTVGMQCFVLINFSSQLLQNISWRLYPAICLHDTHYSTCPDLCSLLIKQKHAVCFIQRPFVWWWNQPSPVCRCWASVKRVMPTSWPRLERSSRRKRKWRKVRKRWRVWVCCFWGISHVGPRQKSVNTVMLVMCFRESQHNLN